MTASSQPAPTPEVTTQALLETIIDSIQDNKGKRIVKIDLTEIEDAPVDYFVICEGDSTSQVKGIGDRVSFRTKNELGMRPTHNEGADSSRWILLDYFDVVVHVFYKETRTFYDLEDLWSDGTMTEYETL